MTKSIIQKDKTHCFICERNGSIEPLERHHVFFGTAKRELSEKYGLTVYICANSCHKSGKFSVHKNSELNRVLQAKAQRIAMNYYKWSVDDFIHIFGKSYI